MPQFAASPGYLSTERRLLERISRIGRRVRGGRQIPDDVPAAAEKAAIDKEATSSSRHQHPPGERRASSGLQRCPAGEDWQAVSGAPQVSESDRRQRNSLSCRQVAPEPAARWRSSINQQTLHARPTLRQPKNIHIADRAIGARHRRITSQSCRAAADVIAKIGSQYPGAVRLLPRAECGRRSDPSPGKFLDDRSPPMCRRAVTA